MAETMKAVVLRGVNDLRVEELPIPEPGEGEVLIKNKVTGVCGTDVHMWAGINFEGTFPFPKWAKLPGNSSLTSHPNKVPY